MCFEAKIWRFCVGITRRARAGWCGSEGGVRGTERNHWRCVGPGTLSRRHAKSPFGTKHRVRRGNVMHEVVTGAVLLSDGVVVSGGV